MLISASEGRRFIRVTEGYTSTTANLFGFPPPVPARECNAHRRGEPNGLTTSEQRPNRIGKDLGKKSEFQNHRKCHRINEPPELNRAHKPKVVSSNLTPATNFS